MSGFVGSHARKRQRNFFLILSILILIGFFTYVFPKLDTTNPEIIPNDNIVPDPKEDMTSLISNIEELELSLFQKDQKINFRDGQINNLKNEIKNTKSQYDALVLQLNEIKNDFSTLSDVNENLVSSNEFKALQDKFTKLNIENDKNISIIKILNTKIDELSNNILLVDKNINKIEVENQKLQKDNKSYVVKNSKLENNISNLKEKILKQKIEIDSYLKQIKDLKDKSHHGG